MNGIFISSVNDHSVNLVIIVIGGILLCSETEHRRLVFFGWWALSVFLSISSRDLWGITLCISFARILLVVSQDSVNLAINYSWNSISYGMLGNRWRLVFFSWWWALQFFLVFLPGIYEELLYVSHLPEFSWWCPEILPVILAWCNVLKDQGLPPGFGFWWCYLDPSWRIFS